MASALRKSEVESTTYSGRQSSARSISVQRSAVTDEMVRANRERSSLMGNRFVVFLGTVSVVCVVACVFSLRLKWTNTALQKQETALVSQLSSLKLENDVAYNRIVSNVNLEEIKRKAMEDFGMVYASADQIVTYEAPAEDYVKQYGAVPE